MGVCRSLHEPLGARMLSDGHACISRVSRVACAPQHHSTSNVAARYSMTVAVEPEPCIVPHYNLYRLYGSSTLLTRDSTAQQIDQNPPTATLAQVQRTLARLLLAKRYANRKYDRIARWVPQSDQGLEDLIPPQRSTAAAALLSVSSGGLREADTRSCLPYPIPPRPRSRATSIQSSLRYARKPIFGGTSHYDARYDADGRDLFGSSRATETAPLRSASWDFSASPAHKPIFASTLDLVHPEQQMRCGPAKRQIYTC